MTPQPLVVVSQLLMMTVRPLMRILQPVMMTLRLLGIKRSTPGVVRVLMQHAPDLCRPLIYAGVASSGGSLLSIPLGSPVVLGLYHRGLLYVLHVSKPTADLRTPYKHTWYYTSRPAAVYFYYCVTTLLPSSN